MTTLESLNYTQRIKAVCCKWGFKVISPAGKPGLFYDFIFYDAKNLIVEDPLVKRCQRAETTNCSLTITTHFLNYNCG
ncbi:hypothetical protein T01_1483 [Trichinella spiralis]|uniref:Uncharacterized protein n=1 Tax=Trichinella spiralis TaxID=6334 RepID=A0A0V1B2A2_TRISP|nr:hypothetical protein T01_1483 [Trichinella spiralis]